MSRRVVGMRGTLSTETSRHLLRPMARTRSRRMRCVHAFGNQCDALLAELCSNPGRQQLCKAHWQDNSKTRRPESSAAQYDNSSQDETEMNSGCSRKREKPSKRNRHTQGRGGDQVHGRHRIRRSIHVEQELPPNLQPEGGRSKLPARKQPPPERCPGPGMRLGQHSKMSDATRQTAVHQGCATLNVCRIFARHPWRGAGFREISEAATSNGDNRQERHTASCRIHDERVPCAVHPAGRPHRGHSRPRS